MRGVIRLIILASAGIAAPALAHGGRDEAAGWTLTPAVLIPLGLAGLLYAGGLARLWRRSDQGRRSLRRDSALFTAGWLVLAGALISPLHSAGRTSFTMHMIEHEVLMLAAALALVASRPGPVFLWAFPAGLRWSLASAARLRLWAILADPFVATSLQAAILIVWHVPRLFDLALASEAWHVIQHLSFVGTALLFWWATLHGRGGPLVSALCLFVTALIGGGLGALMALAESPWYSGYAVLGVTPAGLTPAQDQQLAGLIMWIPGGAWHLAAALWFLIRALRRMEGRHTLAG